MQWTFAIFFFYVGMRLVCVDSECIKTIAILFFLWMNEVIVLVIFFFTKAMIRVRAFPFLFRLLFLTRQDFFYSSALYFVDTV